ncbi:hypothetical protein Tco_1120537, partial [Tanacetum coccineum]
PARDISAIRVSTRPSHASNASTGLYKTLNITTVLSYLRFKLLNLYLYENISSLTTPDLGVQLSHIPINICNQTTGEAMGDGTTGDDGETGKEPDNHLGDSGV